MSRPHARAAALLLALASLALPARAAAPASRPMDLHAVRTFMYQIDKLDAPGAIDRLAASSYDLLVVEPTLTVKGSEAFDAAGMVARLHAGRPGRIVLAYLDVGQAERFRTYWQRAWKPPTRKQKGQPEFLLTTDPDGWSDDYPVAYWDPRWQQLLTAGPQSDVARIMAAGFDGLYLDWVDGYDDPTVAAEAKRQQVDPARAMVDWIATLRATARQLNSNALIVAQNAAYLIVRDARYADIIDGIGFEDTWFRGKANTPWGKNAGGDIPNRYKDDSSTDALVRQYGKYLHLNKPVFTIDYCLKPANARAVYTVSRAAGFVPLVTQVSLSRLTETPPPP
jgi:cysteinyl-tRNA synthetase